MGLWASGLDRGTRASTDPRTGNPSPPQATLHTEAGGERRERGVFMGGVRARSQAGLGPTHLSLRIVHLPAKTSRFGAIQLAETLPFPLARRWTVNPFHTL